MVLWEKWKGRGKKPFYARLVVNGRVLFTTPGYTSRAGRDNVVRSVQKNGSSGNEMDYEKTGKPLPRRRIG